MESFRLIKPAPVLASYVRYYWIMRVDAQESVSERTLPVGCVQLVFHRGNRLLSVDNAALQPQSFVCGQTVSYTDVLSTGNIDMVTVVFQPHAARRFFSAPMSCFYGQNVAVGDTGDIELSDLSKRVADTVGDAMPVQLIERFLMRRLYRLPEYNVERMSAALRLVNRSPLADVSQLAGAACLGNKQFGRVFLEHTGTTPKEFMRIVRMQRALYMLQQDSTLPFAQLAYACGFSDQSHMIREFKFFSGYTPAGYLSVCAPYSDYFSGL